jgi:methanogenic corrinoid protein MtbC1
MKNEKFLEEIRAAIIDGNPEKTREACRKGLEAKLDTMEILNEGMTKAIKIVGDKWNSKEYFLPEVLAAVEALKAGNECLLPYLTKSEEGRAGTVVIGTVKGDIHNIGKNLVTSFLRIAGFRVFDLGEDVPAELFVQTAVEQNADIVGSSAFITSVADEMAGIEKGLKAAGVRDKIFTMVGGAVLDPIWAEKIGADAYGRDAMHAVELAKAFVAQKRT